jgi:hypothetical protein
MPAPDPLFTLIEALEQRQPHAPISRVQVAEALRLIVARLEAQERHTERLDRDVLPIRRIGPKLPREVKPRSLTADQLARLRERVADLT